MKSFLLRRGYFLILGRLTALRTKQKIKNYQGIKELGFNKKNGPVTSTRCSDPCDSAIRVLFQDGSWGISLHKKRDLRTLVLRFAMPRDLGWSNGSLLEQIGHRPSSSTHAFRNIWLCSISRWVAILQAMQESLVCTGGDGGDRVTARASVSGVNTH